ncbi:MAG: hypothetical protein ACTH31_13810, partial [Pseudoclavibacter sp.]
MGRLKGFLRGQPYWIDGGTLVIVVLHFAATWLGWVPNVWEALSAADDQSLASMFHRVGERGRSASLP